LIINLTSLLGKWTSLDKNFDILEGGEVKNNGRLKLILGLAGRYSMVNFC
jgi:hypothetical protein